MKPELDIWGPAEHNGTFRGNQLAFVAANAALNVLEDTKLLDHVKEMEQVVKKYIEENKLPIDSRIEYRGRGLIYGIDFTALDPSGALAGRISRIGAIMTLIAAVMMFLASIIMIISGAVVLANANTQQFGGMSAAANASILIIGITYMIIPVTLIPETVICFIMIKKVEYYQSTLGTDISIARTRCTSVGMMVFCILFNTLAAIFLIINFVKTKTNAAAFDRIEAAQKN